MLFVIKGKVTFKPQNYCSFGKAIVYAKLRMKANADYFFLQVEEKYLVEIFFKVQMDGLDKAVGETFTKLAFEAVEKIITCNVSLLKKM